MAIQTGTAGRPLPVFIAGIRYRSIFEAANETQLSFRWLYKSIEKNHGAPAVIKSQFIVADFWVRERNNRRVAI